MGLYRDSTSESRIDLNQLRRVEGRRSLRLRLSAYLLQNHITDTILIHIFMYKSVRGLEVAVIRFVLPTCKRLIQSLLLGIAAT